MPTTIWVDDDVHRRLAELKRTLAVRTKKDADFNDAIRYLLDHGKALK